MGSPEARKAVRVLERLVSRACDSAKAELVKLAMPVLRASNVEAQELQISMLLFQT